MTGLSGRSPTWDIVSPIKPSAMFYAITGRESYSSFSGLCMPFSDENMNESAAVLESQLLLKIRDVVFAAPDIDCGIMDLNYLPIVRSTTINTTIYVSNPDWALRIADFLSFRPRVGSLQHSIYIREGIVTIDISNVDNTASGHSALFQAPAVTSDLHYLLNLRIPLDSRHGLEKRQILLGTYWQMVGS